MLSEQVFEVSSISSHTSAQLSTPRGRLPRRWRTDADQTRPDHHAAIRRRWSSHFNRKFI